MFKGLQELARKSTLLISIAPEGDLMRVNITQVSKNPDTAPALRPLSLLASADELDRDFAQAMQMWSTTRRSLLDQVAGALDQEDAEDSAANDSSGKAAKQVTGSPKGEKQSKNAEQPLAAEPTDAAPSGEASPKPESVEQQQPTIAADAPTPAAPPTHETDEIPKDQESEKQTGTSETIPAAALEKDWQTTPASNQPPPVPDSEAGKAASTPTPAAQSGGAFSDIEF
ncbi:PRTRC system protein E [Herbaspirillum huttiense]|uniref:PRTRC system protein E n=1 Tax=Herbaspirillum huttiense TaxID=863372 RepID=UPI0003FF9DA4|nr:PRTRC system protein E [Herbaspirillum huttiense]